jgi:hypothetical protein
MRKSFIIITLLLAFNFTTPNSQPLTYSIRHQIEFAQDDKSKDLTENVLLKNKVVMYMRLHVLMIRVALINNNYGFNTS